MTRHEEALARAVLGIGLSVMALACSSRDGSPVDEGTGAATAAFAGNPRVAPPQSHPLGLTYGEWGARWWQLIQSIPFDENLANPANTGANCDLGRQEDKPVWFLAGTFSSATVERTCTIPTGEHLFFPLITFLNDYPCPNFPDFQPAPGQSLEDFLTEGVIPLVDQTTVLEVSVDGAPLKNLFDYRGTSGLFEFQADPSLSAVDGCVPGATEGVSDGFWVMLAPLSPGVHVLTFHAENAFGFDMTVTYDLTVVPGHH